MENKDSSHNQRNFDTNILSDFIIELNIALRLVASYPKNHPVISTSIEKVLGILARLLEFREEIAIGVARDTLMAAHEVLNAKNPVYRNLAKVLFDHDIAAITFTRNTTSVELLDFGGLMLRRREDIRQGGGIEKMVAESGISNIRVKKIDYGYFRTTEEDRIAPEAGDADTKSGSALWENFVHGLLDGTLDPNGMHVAFEGALEPRNLADMMNKLADRSAIKFVTCSDTIASFMKGLDHGESGHGFDADPISKFSAFVGRLNPELRRQFLDGAFTCPGSGQQLAEEILGNISEDVILEVLEDINSCTMSASPLTVSLLQKLSKNNALNGPEKISGEKDYDRLGEKLHIIFSEEERDEFVPAAYQETLRAITSSGRISIPELEDVEELRQTLLSHSVETQICRIILEIMREPPEECMPEALERNFLELMDYLLEMGDFSFLARMYAQLSTSGSDTDRALRQGSSRLLETFAVGVFVEKVLDGLDSWEKSKHPEIRALIRLIGDPFVGPLLGRLAEEQNMSRRKFYIDCLLDQGDKIREVVISRLGDKRWYFVRNLIVILRELGDPAVLKYLRRLCNDPHGKIRQEAVRTFLHFRHPEADDFLIRDLNGPDRELRFNAIQLAEKSRSPLVFEKLLALLNRRSVLNPDFEIRTAAVRALAQIKNTDALPSLVRIIHSKNFLHPQAHARLKTEIISSLGHYPAAAAKPLLEKLSESCRNEPARQARETLKNFQGE